MKHLGGNKANERDGKSYRWETWRRSLRKWSIPNKSRTCQAARLRSSRCPSRDRTSYPLHKPRRRAQRWCHTSYSTQLMRCCWACSWRPSCTAGSHAARKQTSRRSSSSKRSQRKCVQLPRRRRHRRRHHWPGTWLRGRSSRCSCDRQQERENEADK